ncbi:1-aminocyclopropane-1-carboxylate deaminase/D-cysteine desulfhydrase [Parahaliea mediterranea]|uniref:1-aminocyclopropane-1-carboxylate deaminase/D-cysteine desulfhydrase n=1 Tax=Parahaliea mediterranea TaxID=651086 RepID=UPI000E2E8E06|nr:pyridoxal-phosphate dependent enzyme [Parahaliea mediterranea]
MSSATLLDPQSPALWQTLALPLPDGGALPLQVLRLDRCDSLAPGNKLFKLAGLLPEVSGPARVLSFGGPWSNHLHALAALGRERGWQTVGLVRGEALDTPTLREAADWGMALHPLCRADYRQRHSDAFQLACQKRYRADRVIPEGGDCPAGARGCMAIGAAIGARFGDGDGGFDGGGEGAVVALATGTGTTLAGIVAGLDRRFEVLGISALKGAWDTEQRILANLAALGSAGDTQAARWRLYHEFHCGGFARANAELRKLLAWADGQNLPLEPVYTAKALLALQTLADRGELSPGKPLVLVHTGGLQGRRGFDWLAHQPGQ